MNGITRIRSPFNAAIANYSWPGFAVTPDGAGIVFARWDRRESNIMAAWQSPWR